MWKKKKPELEEGEEEPEENSYDDEDGEEPRDIRRERISRPALPPVVKPEEKDQLSKEEIGDLIEGHLLRANQLFAIFRRMA